jgi:hypothetical protein
LGISAGVDIHRQDLTRAVITHEYRLISFKECFSVLARRERPK